MKAPGSSIFDFEWQVDGVTTAGGEGGVVDRRRARMPDGPGEDAVDFALARQLLDPVAVAQLGDRRLPARALGPGPQRAEGQQRSVRGRQHTQRHSADAHRERDHLTPFGASASEDVEVAHTIGDAPRQGHDLDCSGRRARQSLVEIREPIGRAFEIVMRADHPLPRRRRRFAQRFDQIQLEVDPRRARDERRRQVSPEREAIAVVEVARAALLARAKGEDQRPADAGQPRRQRLDQRVELGLLDVIEAQFDCVSRPLRFVD
jgi:hypothetical protein